MNLLEINQNNNQALRNSWLLEHLEFYMVPSSVCKILS